MFDEMVRLFSACTTIDVWLSVHIFDQRRRYKLLYIGRFAPCESKMPFGGGGEFLMALDVF